MSLTAIQNEELTEILATLQQEMKRPDSCIRGRAVDFVNDQLKRHAEYGAGIRLSDRQWKWLRDLNAEVTGVEEKDDDNGLDFEGINTRNDDRWRDDL